MPDIPLAIMPFRTRYVLVDLFPHLYEQRVFNLKVTVQMPCITGCQIIVCTIGNTQTVSLARRQYTRPIYCLKNFFREYSRIGAIQ